MVLERIANPSAVVIRLLGSSPSHSANLICLSSMIEKKRRFGFKSHTHCQNNVSQALK
jgi:hypothetical protein